MKDKKKGGAVFCGERDAEGNRLLPWNTGKEERLLG